MKPDMNRRRKLYGLASCRAALCAALMLLTALPILAAPQQQKKQKQTSTAPAAPSPTLTRTTTRHEMRRMGYGGALTVYGAPEGSITIEAWPKGEVDITADIELRANTEEELTRLAAVNNFLFDAEPNHVQVITTGTHDRKFMKRVARDFPVHLLTMPWKVNYRIRVPAATDLEIYAGRGALNVSGVEGEIRLNAGESAATLQFTGGDVTTTIERGPVNIRVAARSWRGRGADVRVASGDLTIELPANFNGDINAKVLRAGRIENDYPALTPRDENNPPTDRAQQLRAGAGGTVLSFTVGDGTLRIKAVGSGQ